MTNIEYKFVYHRNENRILLLYGINAQLTAEIRSKMITTWSQTWRSWYVVDNVENRQILGIANKPLLAEKKLLPQKNVLINKSTETINTNNCNNSKLNVALKLSIIYLLKKERIAIKCSHTLNKILQKLADVHWSTHEECWHIPCSEKDYNALRKLLPPNVTVDIKDLTTYLHKRKLAVTGKLNTKSAVASGFQISNHNLQLLTRVTEYLQLKAYSTSTIKTYKNELSNFMQTIKNKNADELVTEDVRRYIHYCINKLSLSENTIHSRLNALKFLYEQVLGQERFFVELPRPKKHLQLPKVLGENELRRLFAAPKNIKHKAILFIAYSAGLRVSEVINLRLQDIDRERQQLFIYCSKGKKDRYVRLSPLVLDILEQYYKMCPAKPINYLFEGITKGEPYSIRSAQQIFNEARKDAGILKTISFHSLRHSFATHLLEKGVDVVFIKDILGHFDIRTTERYLHVRRDTLINIDSPIDDLYKPRA